VVDAFVKKGAELSTNCILLVCKLCLQRQ